MDADTTWLYNLRPTTSGGYSFTAVVRGEVFEESLDEEGVCSRCADLNPAVEASAKDLVDEIACLLSAESSQVEIRDDRKKISLRGKLFEYDFRWTFRPLKLPSDRFYSWIVSDLLKCLSYLQIQNHHLLSVVRAKDLELFDYEHSGAALTRKSLRTGPYDPSRLKNLQSNFTDDDELLGILATSEYKDLQDSAASGRRLALAAAAKTPEEEKARAKARRRRIRIKGVTQLFDSDEEGDNSNADIAKSDDTNNVTKPLSVRSPEKRPSQANKKAALAKKLKKL